MIDLAFSETNTSSSSWDVPPLEVGSQTFLSRLELAGDGMAVTRSARGTTAKQVIMLTASGALRGWEGGRRRRRVCVRGGRAALRSGLGVP